MEKCMSEDVKRGVRRTRKIRFGAGVHRGAPDLGRAQCGAVRQKGAPDLYTTYIDVAHPLYAGVGKSCDSSRTTTHPPADTEGHQPRSPRKGKRDDGIFYGYDSSDNYTSGKAGACGKG